MDKNYKTVKYTASAEFVEKRSRFIATAKPVATEAEALEFINELRQNYWDATHNVYAYIIKENNIMRYSDDNEPSGTAGMPVLDMLKKQGLTNVAVVVTRYFEVFFWARAAWCTPIPKAQVKAYSPVK